MALEAGSKLGPYDIIEQIGAGGMGEVYRARDTRLGRTVAIKILPIQLAQKTESRQRMEREARAISSLSHPNICTLYDIGHQNGIHYLVMEFIEGESLQNRLKRGPLPLSTAIPIAIQIADALDKAHRQGIIHRDLKPGNIMLTKAGAKLLDFGLAKLTATDADAAEAQATISDALTGAGMVVGTLQYMAPEQLEGKPIDARTDIFAFGVVFYEMLAGRKAFAGNSQASLISSILSTDPPPIPDLADSPLDRVLRRCLAKDPEERWQSCRDILLELRSLQSGEIRTAQAPSSKKSRRWLPAAIIAAWIASTLLVAALMQRRAGKIGENSQQASLLINPPAKETFQDTIDISPDGRYLAFVALDPSSLRTLFVRPIDSLDAQPVPDSAGAAFPFWSPDSKSIAFFADQKLKRYNLASNTVETLCDADIGRGGSWNADGTIIFSADAGATIYRIPASGGNLTAHRRLQKDEKSQRFPHFLPDGKHYIIHMFKGNPEVLGIFLCSLDSPNAQFLAPALSSAIYASSGELLFISNATLVRQNFDLKTLKLAGEPRRVSDQIWWSGWYPGETAFSLSKNGTLVYRTGGIQTQQLRWFDRDGKDFGPAAPPGAYYEPALSPDGKRVLVTELDPKTGNNDIWMIELARGTTTRLTFEPTYEVTPVWSPDGETVVYGSFPAGSFYLRDLSGSSRPKVLFQSGIFEVCEQWSNDGRYLLYETLDLSINKFDIWVFPFFGDQKPFPFLKTDYDESEARLSADGKWLAYGSNETGQSEVYVRRFPVSSEKWRVSTNGGSHPLWRADGKELFYLSNTGQLMSAKIGYDSGFEASVPEQLFRVNLPAVTETRNQYTATADGQRFLMNLPYPEAAGAPIAVIVNWCKPAKE